MIIPLTIFFLSLFFSKHETDLNKYLLEHNTM